MYNLGKFKHLSKIWKKSYRRFQGSRREWSGGLGVDHHTARKRVNARFKNVKARQKLFEMKNQTFFSDEKFSQVLVPLWETGGNPGSHSWKQVLLQPSDGIKI